MNKRIVILTGSELRHSFFRKYLGLSNCLDVLKTFCEGKEKSIQAVVGAQENNELRQRHLNARDQVERDFFELYVNTTEDNSNPEFIVKGEINSDERVNEIAELSPDLVIAYGCSIIKDPLLEKFPHKILNVHLGLSPYYRGSGTNFWPFVNNELEFVGATFMYMDKGVDTGEIIHQIRPVIVSGDSIHQIGNRLIKDMTKVYASIIAGFDNITGMKQPEIPANERYYKKKDFTEESIVTAYENLTNGMIDEYLNVKDKKCMENPIVINDLFK